jgi:acetyl esterase
MRAVEQVLKNAPPRTVEQERAGHLKAMAGVPGAAVARVEDVTVGGVSGRLYHPAPGTAVPGFVFCHGGGFYLGTLDSYDPVVRVLVQATGCAFVAVDYRLAPEYPFPAAVRDTLAATADVAARTAELGIDPARLGVAGDSAGANLAAVVACQLPGPIALQLLVYGAYDLSAAPTAPPDPDGVNIDDGRFPETAARYLAGADPRDPMASPLLATDLTGLPPAIVVTAEFDRLAEQGRAYAARLRAAGVPVTVVDGAGLDHAFLAWGAMARRPAEGIAEVGAAVRAAFGLPDIPART